MKINSMKINFMKITIVAFSFLCILCAPAAFAQTAAVLSNTPAPIHMQDHPLHAAEHEMGMETSLLGTVSPYTYAKGEVPLAELGSPIYQTPLGDIARACKIEHANDPKAIKVLEQ
jgi:hypothetical protein